MDIARGFRNSLERQFLLTGIEPCVQIVMHPGQAGDLVVASTRKLRWTKEIKLVRSPNGWYRVDLPPARWWDYLLMPITLGLCGATVGSALTILCVNQFYTSVICVLVPVGPFVLIAIGSLVGFLTSLAWWWHAYTELVQAKVRRDIRIERALRRSLTEAQAAQTQRQPHEFPRTPVVSQPPEEQAAFSRILGDIPQPRTPRWTRLDPANLPPYPVLPDCFRRPVQRTRMR